MVFADERERRRIYKREIHIRNWLRLLVAVIASVLQFLNAGRERIATERFGGGPSFDLLVLHI